MEYTSRASMKESIYSELNPMHHSLPEESRAWDLSLRILHLPRSTQVSNHMHHFQNQQNVGFSAQDPASSEVDAAKTNPSAMDAEHRASSIKGADGFVDRSIVISSPRGNRSSMAVSAVNEIKVKPATAAGT
jgi:hypothetical protein